jgi:hypothetical protein
MADLPITFSAPMIRALIAGHKTMTRRALKPQLKFGFKPWQDEDGSWMQSGYGEAGDDFLNVKYSVGDRLYVREAWQALAEYDRLSPKDIPVGSDILYLADREDSPWDARRRQARFMCRWMSRITQTVTEVTITRLQDMNRGDAMLEGCPFPNMAKGDNPLDWFRELWDILHGPGSWAANPWVSVIGFETRMGNIDG